MKMARGVPVFVAVLLAASCGGGEATTTTSTAATGTVEETTTTSTTSVPTVVTESLAGFQPRAIVFANVQFTVTAVSLSNQDLRSYAEGGEPVPGDQFHALLDLSVLNTMSATQTSGLDVDIYRLALGGTSYSAAADMAFLSEATSIIRPSTGVDTFLAFPVPQGTDLTGAVLVIGSPPDRTAELPLTGDVPDPAYPIAVELSGSADGVGPTNGGTIEFTVLGATLSEDTPHERANSPTGLRADEAELFLVLHVRAHKTEGRGGDLLAGPEAFRLVVDGVPRAPWDVADTFGGSDGSPLAEPGVAVDAWVAFLIPSDPVELALEVGDPAEETGLIALDLPLPG